MRNLWNDDIAKECKSDLAMRVYTSNLLGQSDELVLHGGGNTSIKSVVDGEDILFVKGSGWDLVSIRAEGFAPVRMNTLLDMAKLPHLSDSDMVSGQKLAMIDPKAPNPSVEAILHALIPFKVVEHTHADAVVTISNSKNGKENIEKIFDGFLIVDYIMPGFILAQKIYEMSRDLNWKECKGIILHNHGIFTFDDDAKEAYTKMINAVTMAEEFLAENASLDIPSNSPKEYNTDKLKDIISLSKGYDVTIKLNTSDLARYYSSQPNISDFASRGVLTPEHIIRTKRIPLIIEDEDISKALDNYKRDYQDYFERYATDEISLNSTPNYAIVKDVGVVLFGKNEKETNILDDIITHTMIAVLKADKLGGYESISIADSFDMEYWELEQMKIKGK